MDSNAALVVDGLTTKFRTRSGWVTIVDDISFEVKPGEILGIVGESGSGKSVTCLSIMKLLKAGQSQVTARRLLLEGEDISKFDDRRMRRIRGTKMSMILQDPMSSLNPTLTIGTQVGEAVRRADTGRGGTRARSVSVLQDVHLSSPDRRLSQYPHVLSGGMRQRVCIAMAVASRPRVLFADEPTTALDVTIQSQILELLKGLRDEYGMSVVLVTHDVGVVAQVCDQIAVMYAGKIVEAGKVRDVLKSPRHPYTSGLLASVPRIGERRVDIQVMEGHPPDPRFFPSGCRFEPRCPERIADCSISYPPFSTTSGGHSSACWRVGTGTSR